MDIPCLKTIQNQFLSRAFARLHSFCEGERQPIEPGGYKVFDNPAHL